MSETTNEEKGLEPENFDDWYYSNDWFPITQDAQGSYTVYGEQMLHNIALVAIYFRRKGWTDNAIAGMLGNMRFQSRVNPGIWQNRQEPSTAERTNLGYGLVQWTRYTKYMEWSSDEWPKGSWPNVNNWRNNGPRECARIQYEFQNGIQFTPSDYSSMTSKQYMVSTLDAAQLGTIFYWNYERSAAHDAGQRPAAATHMYQILQTIDPEPEPEPQPTTVDLWLLIWKRKVIDRILLKGR